MLASLDSIRIIQLYVVFHPEGSFQMIYNTSLGYGGEGSTATLNLEERSYVSFRYGSARILKAAFSLPCPKSCTKNPIRYLVCLLFSAKQRFREPVFGITSFQAQVWLLDSLRGRGRTSLSAGGLGRGPFSLTVSLGTRTKL